MAERIDIDGSEGEGGGQILRTALTLSLVTGRPFRARRVRAGRPKPGLLRQHLTAIEAAAEVGEASVTGAHLGSQEVTFAPRARRAGDWAFAVGAAGSATLVFQAVLPALLLADGPSRLVIEGGTHNPWAPPFEFLERAFLPLLRRMGATVEVRLDRRGYYPAGGGRFSAIVEPVRAWVPLDLRERGAIRGRQARVLLANLDRGIATREESTLRRLLPEDLWPIRCELEQDGRGPGNAVLLEVDAEHVTEVFTEFGRREVRAETVAENVVAEMQAWLDAEVPVGPYLADQLLVPLAVGAGGVLRTLPLTRHTRTNAQVIAKFLPDRAPVLDSVDSTARIEVPPPP